MGLFTERVANMAAWLAQRAGVATGAAISRAWHSESLAPKAAALRPSPPASAIPRPLDWTNRAEVAPGIVRQQGSALPRDARPKAVLTGSALPTDARPKVIVPVVADGSVLPRSAVPAYVGDEARKQAALAKAARARQAEDQASHQGRAHQEELQL